MSPAVTTTPDQVSAPCVCRRRAARRRWTTTPRSKPPPTRSTTLLSFRRCRPVRPSPRGRRHGKPHRHPGRCSASRWRSSHRFRCAAGTDFRPRPSRCESPTTHHRHRPLHCRRRNQSQSHPRSCRLHCARCGRSGPCDHRPRHRRYADHDRRSQLSIPDLVRPTPSARSGEERVSSSPEQRTAEGAGTDDQHLAAPRTARPGDTTVDRYTEVLGNTSGCHESGVPIALASVAPHERHWLC